MPRKSDPIPRKIQRLRNKLSVTPLRGTGLEKSPESDLLNVRLPVESATAAETLLLPREVVLVQLEHPHELAVWKPDPGTEAAFGYTLLVRRRSLL